MTVDNDVFIGPNAVFTNDIYPRSKVYHEQPDKILIKTGATIGANAVIVAGHTIGEYAFIGAGAVITKDIPPYTIWLGNPAKMAGYVCACAKRLPTPQVNSTSKCDCGKSYKFDGENISPHQ